MIEKEELASVNNSDANEIIKVTAGLTGAEFYRTLVWQIAVVLKVRCVIVCEVIPPDLRSAQTLAIWEGDKFHNNFEYELIGTQWKAAVDHKSCYCSENIVDLLPESQFLPNICIDNCLGVPLFDSLGKPLGVLAVLHQEALTNVSCIESILDVTSVRTAVEIKRMREEKILRLAKKEAECTSRMTTELLESLNHDLRSPMNVVLGYAKLLLSDSKEPLNKVQHDRVNWILKGAERLMEIIDEIPVSPGEVSKAEQTDNPTIEKNKSVPPIKTSGFSKILYVEDNIANLRLMEKFIKRRPDTLLFATPRAQEGLDLAFSQHFDLIMLDINLPGMSGYEVLKQLKSRRDTRDIPVIAVSADAMPKHIEKAQVAGFQEYVTKPFDFAHLNEIIDNALAVGAGIT